MKPTFFRLGALALSLTIVLTISLIVIKHGSDQAALPLVENRLSTQSPCPDELNNKTAYLVISVPNDDEVYISKKKVEVSQISTKIRPMLDHLDFCNRVVFINVGSNVKSQTLDLVVRQAKDAGINRIEFITDKKKRGGKQ